MRFTTAKPNPGAIYYVRNRSGYFMSRNGGIPEFLDLSPQSRHLAPRFVLAQAEKVAALCTQAGVPCDVSTT